jgi:hypothetical protein
VKLTDRISVIRLLYSMKLMELTGGGDGTEDHGRGSDESEQFGEHCQNLDLGS